MTHRIWTDVFLNDTKRVMLLVEFPTRVTYRHQCGGMRCAQRTMEAFLVPCDEVDASVARRLERLSRDDEGLLMHGFDAQLTDLGVRAIDDELQRGFWTSSLEVDPRRCDGSVEAWVHVRPKGRPSWLPGYVLHRDMVLIWTNRD